MDEEKHRYFIKLAYNGRTFHGWQIQKGVPTVQEAINDSLCKLTGEDINVVGCGRTDTGVHAGCFYAHFDVLKKLDEETLDKMLFRMNQMLGSEIAIYSIFPVGEKNHSRFDAISRTYHYRIARNKNPFEADYAYYLFGDIGLDKMSRACEILKEYKDFECFSKVNTQVNTFICDIKHAQWREEGDMLLFEIRADRFLRNMVRAIVGTMLDIGMGKCSLEEFRQIIESKNRSEAGYSVPAHGLFLADVEYPEGMVPVD
ncbi:MAG: tRNA pseudouridine(38-40) synthase TruA [Bacteroidales bacterium]|nr:tRNA pseudouridine(38-40) synthase TruA [Bacteroidales bacterium]MCF8344832.1 tRNA pseudouridine(38-40) synthase TruA [Bacteroidales bacterium]MCF8377043.1 tRNA pseudouridine(38-40) synthase TruA [Bacteroidales bacterium]MCF8400917.1 tRNA pseudouridine(38-40) synthase TruA [Bacteroidales bacterium]